jgi:2-oxo-4-hydroxy-4-carboxy-5-ureidoimidazoline decarboxylase
MPLDVLNTLPVELAIAELLRCCGSTRWATLMAKRRPFASQATMMEVADATWWSLGRKDWLEAFASHPRIGVVPGGMQGDSPRSTGDSWARDEQAGMNAASDGLRERLAAANREYEARFGYIFIVCATGKSAGEMLAILEKRLPNPPVDEMNIAAEEQRKITRLRLEKLLS